MMSIDEIYKQSIVTNDNNLKFWENYLQQLKSLDFNVYTEKLKVPILVPMGSRLLFRGELQHTNEVTVSLGADYFAKCSIAQAEILRQRRIKDAESKVEMYTKEKGFLENRISFANENVFAKDGQEILEVYSEEEDKAWREKHRENVRKYKQSKTNVEPKPKDDISDAELWERLEELELQEELENELLDNYNEIVDKRKENTFLQNEETQLRNSFKEENNNQESKKVIKEKNYDKNKPNNQEEVSNVNTQQTDLLQKVLDKQTELQNKLHEIKHREREQSKTEQDLIARLDEMEQLDDLEDEMERLEDILQNEDVETDDSSEATNNSNKTDSSSLKKSITFADDNADAETLQIEFSHTDIEPDHEPYDLKKGVRKPSDVYVAYSGLFDNKTPSILKKSKYGPESPEKDPKVGPSTKKPRQVMFAERSQTVQSSEPEETPKDRTIVIKDVVENVGVNQHHIEGGARPTSLFKKKRMQKK